MAGAAAEIPIAGEGRCNAYVARPPRGSGPAVVLIPPIFGTTPAIESMAQELAVESYAVVVRCALPDDVTFKSAPAP